MREKIKIAIEECESQFKSLMNYDRLEHSISHWNLMKEEGHIDSVESALMGDFYGRLFEIYGRHFDAYDSIIMLVDETSQRSFSSWFSDKISEIKKL